ncbi:MAG TPA: 50S ribosomal protein L19 [Candidatus Udaeobacter sp.]|jgi:large subunit ribosomal protein L19|nr:50S ribosomal protein L19 [Candidatus Udaeobacter sp.]
MDTVGQLEAAQAKKEIPALRPGEAVRVHVKVVEGEKERTQVFEGIVIGVSGSGSRATFTVRKVSYGVGVERIFPIHSPRIDKVEIISRGKVRRAKLYYLRQRSGKAARLYGEDGPG